MSLETLLLYFFAAAALAGGVLMLVARHPMRVALALISSMVSLAGIYAILGVHVIAVFQVLIYVGAVMVFMVYVIMLLDVRDPSFLERYGRALVPSVAVAGVIAAALGVAVSRGRIATAAEAASCAAGGRTGRVRGAAVLGRVPRPLLAALRAHLRAAARGRRRRDRRDQGRAEARWIGRSCC